MNENEVLNLLKHNQIQEGVASSLWKKTQGFSMTAC